MKYYMMFIIKYFVNRILTLREIEHRMLQFLWQIPRTKLVTLNTTTALDTELNLQILYSKKIMKLGRDLQMVTIKKVKY